MAAVNDCFTIGSSVLCTTCFNEEVEGEVLAFDHNTKMLILKCRSKNSEQLNDVYVLNLSLCSNVKVIKECNGNFVEDPQKLNLEQIKIRLRNTVQQRQMYLKSRNADVSLEAQELYRTIAKQFKSNEVSWQGPNIQIFNEVTVSPPYRVENVISTSNNKSLCNYIKKMIEKFFEGASQDNSSAAAGTSSASSSTSSSLSSSAPSASAGTSSSSNAASGSPVPAN
ncbi:protein LSM12 homolog A [Ceratitis capitata]|uniref:Protein LSM12-A n=2 Tax=Ceratitis capitata TaxID=7213 RepID=W8BKI6_CERCA|nr:protein LSM12 homolog A [Ceratitis capitata]